MFLGRVAGTVWSTVKWPEARGLKLLLVRPYRLGDLAPGAVQAGAESSEPTDDLVVCADTLDAGPGDDVLVAFGQAARVAVSEKLPPGTKPNVPIDAAVVAVVDRVQIERVASE
ncbi:MAG TPA: EutN/CcmL family microcompartment protein [Polyangia bacterium]|nr:EutN/CcmL family microcompartment protein [Polyangia bacterium]